MQLPQPVNKTVAEEEFCREYASLHDEATAYRIAFRCPELSSRQARIAARTLLAREDLQTRIAEVRTHAENLTNASVANVLANWLAIVSADPNELIQHRRNCCRYCYGVEHRYQWTDGEFWEATDKAILRSQPAPEAPGGFGFDKTRGPNLECPECGGEGIGEVWLNDTRYMSASARSLYKGVEKTKNGVKVMMSDRDEALNNIARFLGMFVERYKVEDLNKDPNAARELQLEGLSVLQLMDKFKVLAAPKNQSGGKRGR